MHPSDAYPCRIFPERDRRSRTLISRDTFRLLINSLPRHAPSVGKSILFRDAFCLLINSLPGCAPSPGQTPHPHYAGAIQKEFAV